MDLERNEQIESGLARQKAELIRLMFVFGLGTVLPLGGLIVTRHPTLP